MKKAGNACQLMSYPGQGHGFYIRGEPYYYATVLSAADTFLAGLATSGHQGLAANLYTMASDLFPKRAVASIVGLGSAAGSATAIAFSLIVGVALEKPGSYAIPFVIAGIGYPLVTLCLHLLEPEWKPVDLQTGGGFPVK